MMDDDPRPDNIDALQQLYFTRLLEGQRAFEVADQLVGLFDQGLLPLNDHEGVRRLVDGWRSARVPGGEGEVTPNRDFADLWLRFLAAVDAFDRQQDPAAIAAIRLLAHPELRIRALLLRSAAYRALPPDTQQQIAQDTTRVIDSLVSAVDFPAFVAGLINGTFNAIVDASIEQMDAYGKLIHDVACRIHR